MTERTPAPLSQLAPLRPQWPDAEDDDPVRPLWRALMIYRPLAYGFAVVASVVRWSIFIRPAWAITGLAAMLAWTVFVTAAYSSDRGRTLRVAVLDVVATVVCMGATTLAVGSAVVPTDVVIITSVWAGGPVLALAIVSGMTPA